MLFNKKHNHTFFKAVKTNFLKLFVIYLFLLCIGFYFFDFSERKNENLFNKINITTKQINENSKYEFLSSKIIPLFTKSQNYSVKIQTMSLKDSMVILKLQSKQKESIYKFLKEIKDVKIEDMSFDKTKKEYFANAIFKIYRK